MIPRRCPTLSRIVLSLPYLSEVCQWSARTNDVSEIYGEGESERIIGRLLKETPKDVKDKIYIATKCEYDADES
jgi:predicted oxidoreductase